MAIESDSSAASSLGSMPEDDRDAAKDAPRSAGRGLSDAQRALLDARLAGRVANSARTAAADVIGPRPRTAEGVLSFAQQRLWVLDQLVPGSAFYTEGSALRFEAAIEPAILEQAINEIVARHEVLRTTFVARDGQPVARVAPSMHIALEQSDLSDLSPTDRHAEVVRRATEDMRRPFDLERGPLLRTSLLHLGRGEWVFLLSMHHIVCDGWSSAVFSRELATLYADFALGRESSLPRLPIQYGDFAHWQRGWLRGGALARQLEYWRERLRDLPVLDLPTDRPRPPVPSFAGRRHPFALSGPLTERLEALSRRQSATLFMTLLAGFDIVLQRITGQDDIAIGTPIANRTRKELEPLIGFFVNMLVMRCDLSGRPTYREVLRRVRERALEAYAHQDLPFEKLVEELQPQRDLARNPLFQVIFQLHADQTQPAARPAPSDAAASLIDVERGTSKFDLRLELKQTPDGVVGALEYSTDLFDAARIARLCGYLEHVYESMARDPDQRITSEPLVRGAERTQIARWARETEPQKTYTTLGERFLAQAAATPDAIALLDGTRTLCFVEVAARAAELAQRLRARGVGADTIVAVPAVRSAATVVAELGIVLAGGAYLPLELTDPDVRLRQLIDTAKAAIAVDASGADRRWRDLELATLPLDLDPPLADVAPPSEVARPDNLAYVMYTSGSTGIPKGVAVPHRAIMRLVRDADFCALDSDERLLLLAPMTFDASTLEMWAPLLNGGRLVIHPSGALDLDALAETIRRGEVTTLWLTAGLFQQIVDSRLDLFRGVRQVLAGGDVLSRRHVRTFLEHYPAARLINGYGPTENTTFSCCHRISADDAGSIPIGTPIGGGRIYVLDRFGELAPIGVPGELCVGGDGLARGYLGEPGHTAACFVPDPFNGRGARMYRTGDLVRYLPSGALEFLGRKDRQVKIRGFRVEPQEVETALAAHPDVRDAAVIVRRDERQRARLVAYVAPTPRSTGGGASALLDDAERAVLGSWRELYDRLYENAAADADFDISGWRSSYTGRSIPPEEMRAWLEGTMERIRRHAPRRLLEIGCGTGLLAYRLAPDLELYRGTDISAPVIERLRAGLAKRNLGAKTELCVRAADDFRDAASGAFDTVVLNSVVQYFPDVHYLLRVLDGALQRLAPGGRIFIGDVRSLDHLAEFRTAVELAAVEDPVDCAHFRRRVADGIRAERELLIAPRWFYVWAARDPRISSIDIEWKRDDAANELNQFRYDVTLHVGPHPAHAGTIVRLDWDDDALTTAQLRELLVRGEVDSVTVAGAPNSRIRPLSAVWDLIRTTSGTVTAGALRAAGTGEGLPAMDQYWRAAEGTAYEAYVGPAPARRDGCVLNYRRRGLVGPRSEQTPNDGAALWSKLVSSPLHAFLTEKLVPKLRAHLTERLPSFMHPSAYVLLDALPLTRNGKLDTDALPAPIAERSVSSAQERLLPRSDVEKKLARIWADVLGLDQVGVHDNFFGLGGDSILSIQIVSRANSEGLRVSASQLFENQTVAALAKVATRAAETEDEQAPLTGPCGLTPAQLWLLDSGDSVDHFNQAVLLQVPSQLDAGALDRAFRSLVRRHDALRLRFSHSEHDGWRAEYAASDDQAVLEHVSLGALGRGAQRRALEQACADRQASLNIAEGPMLRAVLFDLGPAQAARLLVVAHHLVIDGVSWRILFEQLWQAYEQLAAESAPPPIAKTATVAAFAARLRTWARSAELAAEAAYWLQVAPHGPTLLAVDADGTNKEADYADVRVALDEKVSQVILTEAPRAFGTQINDVLLTAFARAMTRWSELTDTYFDLEGHGREPLFPDLDLSRTIGWFTSIFPVTLTVDPNAPIVTTLLDVQKQLAAIPHRGVGFGVLRYLSDDAQVRAALASLPPRDVSFNYLGQFGGREDGAIRIADENPGPARAPHAERRHLIEVDSSVSFGRLLFTWGYSRAQYDADSIREVADMMREELAAVAAAVESGEGAPLRAARFPAARMSEDDFSRLVTKLAGRAGKES